MLVARVLWQHLVRVKSSWQLVSPSILPTLTNLTFSCSLASSSNASFICWHGCDHGAQKWTTTKLFGDGRGGSVIKLQISNTHVHSSRHEGKVHKLLLVSRGRFISSLSSLAGQTLTWESGRRDYSLSPLDYLGPLMMLAHDSRTAVLHYFYPQLRTLWRLRTAPNSPRHADLLCHSSWRLYTWQSQSHDGTGMEPPLNRME